MAKVAVSRGLLVAMAVSTGALALALVFFLGRESARRKGSGAEVPAMSINPAPGPLPSSPGIPSPAPSQAPPVATPPASPGGGLPQANDPLRAAVAAYFETVDHITPGQFTGGPEAAAQEMVAGLARGESGAFDRIIEQSDSARRRMAALAPPEPCAAYHRESVAVLEESLGMLRAMKKALEGADAEGGVAALASRANALRARTEALQREEQGLRQRFALAR